ncbi:MAG: helix-turn-helix domain-containing protein [Oenococcus sp.]|uniref:helix-turn-helix domain-containing protein n=1 Tax=Oenococcus sp. TaxID=1979414 RepID=UPI0039E92C3C
MFLSTTPEKMKIGQTFKRLRLDKHFTMKEVAAGEVSRSFVYKFEQGEYDISVSKLLFLLNRIGVSFDELMIAANNYENYEDSFFVNLFLAIESKNQKKLAELAELNHHGSSLTEQLVYSLAVLFLDTNGDSGKKDEAAFIFHYLTSVATWTRFELQVFNYVMPYITSDEQLSLLSKSRDCVLNYKNSLNDLYINYFSYIVVGMVHSLLQQNKITASHQVITTIEEVREVTGNERLTASFNFVQALVQFYEDSSAEKIGPVLESITPIVQLNNKYARQLEKIWDYHIRHLNLSDQV